MYWCFPGYKFDIGLRQRNLLLHDYEGNHLVTYIIGCCSWRSTSSSLVESDDTTHAWWTYFYILDLAAWFHNAMGWHVQSRQTVLQMKWILDRTQKHQWPTRPTRSLSHTLHMQALPCPPLLVPSGSTHRIIDLSGAMSELALSI